MLIFLGIFLKSFRVLRKFGKHFIPIFLLFSGHFVDEVISGRFWKNCSLTSISLGKLYGQYNGENCLATAEKIS